MHTYVVGAPIVHSLSPTIFDAAGVGIHCERAHVELGSLGSFLRTLGCDERGLSVTMPLKHEALSLCDWVDPLAEQVGAINTIVIETHGTEHTYRGFNTDVQGIVGAVEHMIGNVNDRPSVLILGSGATASSAIGACAQLGYSAVAICSRKSGGESTAYATAKRCGVVVTHIPYHKAAQAILAAHLVISTLPFNVADTIALEIDGKNTSHIAVLDAAYNPYPSALTQAILNGGGVSIPGYEMLIHQGIEQARLFTGKEPDSDAIHKAISAHFE